MKNKQISLKAKRQRKFLLVLPLLALPFMTLFFWALGGGKGQAAAKDNARDSGFISTVPQPYFKKQKREDKLAYYQAADRDSVKLKQEIKSDPYRRGQADAGDLTQNAQAKPSAYQPIAPSTSRQLPDNSPGGPSDPDAKAAKVYRKIGQLQKALRANGQKAQTGAEISSQQGIVNGNDKETVPEDQDIAKLEEMMQAMQADNEDSDPQMQQISEVLDKIMAVQHPGLMDSIKDQSAKESSMVFQVSSKASNAPSLVVGQREGANADSVLETKETNGFYGLDESTQRRSKTNTIPAETRESQKLVNGSTIKLYLEKKVFLGGQGIPAGTPVYGMVQLSGGRLDISVSSVIYQGSIYPVALKAYDLDGIEGLYVPGSINRKAVKEQAGQSLNGLGLNSLDNSIRAQATSAGIQTVKSLLAKKTRLEKVIVKAGYQVLLASSQAFSTHGEGL